VSVLTFFCEKHSKIEISFVLEIYHGIDMANGETDMWCTLDCFILCNNDNVCL